MQTAGPTQGDTMNPGWYTHPDGTQVMIYHLDKMGQWTVHFDNGEAHQCEFSYIEQAGDVVPLVPQTDEQEGMVLSKIVIEHVMTDEMSGVSVTASDSEGNIPPLLEMLGMVEMARDTVYAIASGEHDED